MAAAMTIVAGGVSVSFLTVRFAQAGFLHPVPTLKAEILETPGVNGRRWRSQGYQMEPATLECLADGTTWAGAITLCNSLRSLMGFFGQVTLTTGGTPKTYKDIYISSVEATPVIGNVTGNGASANSTAHVRAILVLEVTDFRGQNV